MPICHVIYALLSIAKAELGILSNKPNQCHLNVVSNHHGHPVQLFIQALLIHAEIGKVNECQYDFGTVRRSQDSGGGKQGN